MKLSSMTSGRNRTKWMKFSALAAGIAWLLGFVYSTSNADERSAQDVSAELSSFFKAFLDRRLLASERRKVTEEYIAYYGSDTCEDSCVKYLEQLRQLVPR
ncbi:MAG: hypothetical protein AB2556_26660, partial [Candidatus Thiodiazotropha sp.]